MTYLVETPQLRIDDRGFVYQYKNGDFTELNSRSSVSDRSYFLSYVHKLIPGKHYSLENWNRGSIDRAGYAFCVLEKIHYPVWNLFTFNEFNLKCKECESCNITGNICNNCGEWQYGG